MTVARARIYAVLLVLAAAAGCGFQLRGAIELPSDGTSAAT